MKVLDYILFDRLKRILQRIQLSGLRAIDFLFDVGGFFANLRFNL